MSEKIITAIDLGSSKICVIIASLQEKDRLEIKGVGEVESKGIENGLVKDLQATAESIKKAVQIAEEQSGLEIENIFVAISGQHIKSKKASGRISIAIGNQSCEINNTHIDQAINDAKNSIKRESGSDKFEILHCIPQMYDIDSQTGILNPIGMSGYSLTIHTNIILAESTHLRNIRKAFEMGELGTPYVVLGSIATTEAVVSEDERRLGCVIIDIGEGTSELTIYQNSYLKTYMCVPRGGALVTHDIAIGLRTPPNSAENIKIEFGNAVPITVDPNKTIEVESIGGRASQKIPLSLITDVINNRIKEILDACYKDILSEFTRLDSLTAGVVLTGGSSLITNIHLLVEDKNGFNLPCRIAYPDMRKISGAVSRIDSPNYTCVIGLLYYAVKNESVKNSKSKQKKKQQSNTDISNFFKKIIKKISEL